VKILGRIKDSLQPQQRIKLGDVRFVRRFGARGAGLSGRAENAQRSAHGAAGHARQARGYLSAANDLKRAVEQLQAIVSDDPQRAGHYQLARLAYEEERWKDAIEHLKKVMLFNPDFEQAHYDLAAAQIAQGNTGDALAALERARAKFPPNFVIEYLLATAHTREKNYAEAVNRFTAAEVIAQATDTNRLNYSFYFQLGAASSGRATACRRKIF
jgi:tetratricopeptide (TPR) repeat protein